MSHSRGTQDKKQPKEQTSNKHQKTGAYVGYAMGGIFGSRVGQVVGGKIDKDVASNRKSLHK